MPISALEAFYELWHIIYRWNHKEMDFAPIAVYLAKTTYCGVKHRFFIKKRSENGRNNEKINNKLRKIDLATLF